MSGTASTAVDGLEVWAEIITGAVLVACVAVGVWTLAGAVVYRLGRRRRQDIARAFFTGEAMAIARARVAAAERHRTIYLTAAATPEDEQSMGRAVAAALEKHASHGGTVRIQRPPTDGVGS